MRRMVKVVTLMAVPLILVSHLAAASSRTTSQSKGEHHGEHEVNVTADDISAVAEGDGAVAHVRIGNMPTHAKQNRRVTVRVGKITRKAVGPGAVACIELPSEEDGRECAK